MNLANYRLDILHDNGEFLLSRGLAIESASPDPPSILVQTAKSEHPQPGCVRMLEHELALRTELDATWAVRPLALAQHGGRPALVLEDLPGEPLNRLLEALPVGSASAGIVSTRPAMELALFLRLAVHLASAVREMHRRGIVHKNIKPAHVLVNAATDSVWLMGFGIASRLPRERQAPGPPETIAGTLAYMAPEQTGRMNRSIDSRSDLYALGITLYEMLTGSLPFMATDAMEWVHCHIARQAVPPHERANNVPTPLSAIIMKLLAKTAEERYQTAAGLERDLRRCRAQFEAEERVDDFVLGQDDRPDRLPVPEKLYGRVREIATLLGAFDRVAKGGAPELVLVSGYSGIGKSSVVNELQPVLVPPRGLFASGKFDQYKRDIPYSTLAQAFQSLVLPLLGKSEADLASWRDALQAALGPTSGLIADLVPEVKLILGEPPPVPELPPQDAQRRFRMVFRRFLTVFARPEHPLALFLDDLQWLDVATLDLLEDLLTHPDVRHLLLIGAYRDNEVAATHPLKHTLHRIRSAGAPVQDIVLAALAPADVAQLVADSLYCDLTRAASLAELVHGKTGGNPFFVIQFLTELVDEELLTFDRSTAQWLWDLPRIHAKGYTDNVVDLMIGKISRLPIHIQKFLQQLACLGNTAKFELLAIVREASEEELQSDLREVLQTEFVFASQGSCRFLHDRVQEAAYSLIPEQQRAEAHLRLGKLLITRIASEQQEEAIFEIVNQLNRGAALITARRDREQLAEFDLIAGKRAKVSTAYASALRYFSAGMELLRDDGWDRRPELMFALGLHRAECEFLIGDLEAAEPRLTMLSSRAVGPGGRAAVTCLRVDLYAVLGRADRAVAVCLEYLQQVGVEWAPHPTDEDVRREYDRIWQLMADRPIEDLIDLPLMSDAGTRATMDVLTRVMPSAQCTDEKLLCLTITGMVNLSLEYGNCNASCCGYVWLGLVLSSYFDNSPAARRFGQLSLDLVERRGLDAFKARVYEAYGIFVSPWAEHVRSGRSFLQRAFSEANRIGDLTYASYCCNNFVTNSLASGERLSEVEREAREGMEFARKADFGLVVDIIRSQLCLIRTLRGLTRDFKSFDDAGFDERRFEDHLEADSNLAVAACWYWIRKLQARVFAQDHASALAAAARAKTLLWTSPAFFEQAEYHFYAALARAGSMRGADAVPLEQQNGDIAILAAHHRQIQAWAKHCPENFADRSALVAAEIARIEGRDLDAQRLYERAIESARANGFVHNEALANELTAQFYAGRGFATIALAYLRNARYCYLRWGADGKVGQLDRLHPHLRPEQPGDARTGTIEAPLEQLDLATVIKLSQTVSSEMVLEKLLDTLLRTAIEHAGAVRALLILSREGEQRIAAQATTRNDTVMVQLCDEAVAGSLLPDTILHYVLHTRESVILDDAAAPHPFWMDRYILERHARSVLCLPLTNQAKLIGALYLENNFAPGVFVPARAAVLKLLASQAAISLENSRLYRDLAERESRIRRLVDANIIGIFIWELGGRILEANEAFLTLVGYDREDLVSGRLLWTNLTPPDWLDRDIQQRIPELKESGSLQPFEKEYFRKDGSRVPVLIGVAAFDGTGNHGVAYVLDLTERKRSENALNRAAAELARVSKIAALSALAGSIAHEVNQPLAGIVINAQTSIRMLTADPPNVTGALENAGRTVRDGTRAAQVIARLRAMFSKGELTLESLDLNEAAREVIAISSEQLQRNRIILQSELADDLPVVTGDRIQLQQVILNLLRNASDAMADVHDRPRELLLKTERENDNRVRLTIRDAGVGLSQQIVESLFEPFCTTKSGGMGIGLFVSRSIVERHRGHLSAEPNKAGPGTTFSFSLPGCGHPGPDTGSAEHID